MIGHFDNFLSGPDPGPVSPTLCTTATGVRGRGRELGAPTPTLVPTRHVLPVVIFMVIHTLTIMKVSSPNHGVLILKIVNNKTVDFEYDR